MFNKSSKSSNKFMLENRRQFQSYESFVSYDCNIGKNKLNDTFSIWCERETFGLITLKNDTFINIGSTYLPSGKYAVQVHLSRDTLCVYHTLLSTKILPLTSESRESCQQTCFSNDTGEFDVTYYQEEVCHNGTTCVRSSKFYRVQFTSSDADLKCKSCIVITFLSILLNSYK